MPATLVALSMNLLWSGTQNGETVASARGIYAQDSPEPGVIWSNPGYDINPIPDSLQHLSTFDLANPLDIDWSLPDSEGYWSFSPFATYTLPPNFTGGPASAMGNGAGSVVPPTDSFLKLYDIYLLATYSDGSTVKLRPASFYGFTESGNLSQTPGVDGSGMQNGANAYDGNPNTFALFNVFGPSNIGSSAVYFNYPPPPVNPPAPPVIPNDRFRINPNVVPILILQYCFDKRNFF